MHCLNNAGRACFSTSSKSAQVLVDCINKNLQAFRNFPWYVGAYLPRNSISLLQSRRRLSHQKWRRVSHWRHCMLINALGLQAFKYSDIGPFDFGRPKYLTEVSQTGKNVQLFAIIYDICVVTVPLPKLYCNSFYLKLNLCVNGQTNI